MKWILLCLAFLFAPTLVAAELVVRFADESHKSVSLKTIESTLPLDSFTTHLPWLDGPHTFSGVKVTDLLDYLGVSDVGSVSFVALNDYASSTQIKDILDYEPIIAYHLNGKKMKVRNKGPFWLVFNLDKYPEINNQIYYTQMVWQIDEVLIHEAP